jgi:parvulin-like peptidyl-prolyl isomerase
MLQTLKKLRILVTCIIIGLTVAAIFLVIRSRSRLGPPTAALNHAKPNLAYLSLLNSHQLLAKVDVIESRSEDLKNFLQLDFHGQLLHSSMSSEDLSARIGSGLDQLIEEELLAQEAKRRGLTTSLEGAQARRDLSGQYLRSELTKLSPLSDREVRSFYKDHGEKFLIPGGIQVRELFLPHRGDPDRKGKREKAFQLAEELAARARKGESLEELGKQYVPADFLDRTKGYLFKGAVMDAADEQRVLALRPGEILGPIRIEGGYSVFQGIASVRARRIPFYEAQEKIKIYLEVRRQEELRKKLVSELRQRVSVQRFGPDTELAAVR